jgi:hypothetical protein
MIWIRRFVVRRIASPESTGATSNAPRPSSLGAASHGAASASANEPSGLDLRMPRELSEPRRHRLELFPKAAPECRSRLSARCELRVDRLNVGCELLESSEVAQVDGLEPVLHWTRRDKHTVTTLRRRSDGPRTTEAASKGGLVGVFS